MAYAVTAQVVRLPCDASVEHILDTLAADGCVIVENLVEAAGVEQLSADLQPWFDVRALGHDDFSGYSTRRVSALVARSDAARALALNATALAVCDALLLPNCETYRLQVTHMVDIGPGEIRQRVHRDDGIYPAAFHQALPDMPKLVHCMWAVTDFSAANGATSLVPGSHLWQDRERVAKEHEIVPAVMSKGSVAFYLGSTLHGGGANVSAEHRVGALFGYALGWLRQEENMYLTCPPDMARGFPERLQRLIGYEMFSRTAGWVDDAHPIMLLRDDAEFDALRVL